MDGCLAEQEATRSFTERTCVRESVPYVDEFEGTIPVLFLCVWDVSDRWFLDEINGEGHSPQKNR